MLICWKPPGQQGSCQKKLGKAVLSAMLGGERNPAGIHTRITRFTATPAAPKTKSIQGKQCENLQLLEEMKASSNMGVSAIGKITGSACLADFVDLKPMMGRESSDVKELLQFFASPAIAAEAERYVARGLELEIDRTTQIQMQLANGQAITQKVSEVVHTTSIKPGTFDPKIFEMPSDYQIVDKPTLTVTRPPPPKKK